MRKGIRELCYINLRMSYLFAYNRSMLVLHCMEFVLVVGLESLEDSDY